MGASCSGPKESAQDVAEKQRSKQLERDLKNQNDTEAEVAKLLLLGAGESGKSTLFKQMIQIYGKGFSNSERKGYRPIIYTNIITAITTLCEQLENDELKIADKEELSDEAKEARDLVMEKSHGSVGEDKMDEDVAKAIVTLWADPAIQQVYGQRAQYQLDTSANYFLDRVEELSADDYLPTEQDVLRSRVRTTGIVENEFVIDGSRFKMFDVGGQRNERKKWIHCFENVTSIIFVAAISEYDQVLYEDANTNRMHEALNLFDSICNSRWFLKTSIILFLNKRDLFKEKIKKVPLTVAFADYTGRNKYDEALAYITEQFEGANKQDKKIYIHATCATDTDNISHVFNSVKDIIIRGALTDAGLLE